MRFIPSKKTLKTWWTQLKAWCLGFGGGVSIAIMSLVTYFLMVLGLITVGAPVALAIVIGLYFELTTLYFQCVVLEVVVDYKYTQWALEAVLPSVDL